VVVRAHQAERVHLPVECAHDLEQDREEHTPVVVVQVDEAFLDAPAGDVVDAVWEQRARPAGHGVEARRPSDPRGPL
jgi:hypothetical protein